VEAAAIGIGPVVSTPRLVAAVAEPTQRGRIGRFVLSMGGSRGYCFLCFAQRMGKAGAGISFPDDQAFDGYDLERALIWRRCCYGCFVAEKWPVSQDGPGDLGRDQRCSLRPRARCFPGRPGFSLTGGAVLDHVGGAETQGLDW